MKPEVQSFNDARGLGRCVFSHASAIRPCAGRQRHWMAESKLATYSSLSLCCLTNLARKRLPKSTPPAAAVLSVLPALPNGRKLRSMPIHCTSTSLSTAEPQFLALCRDGEPPAVFGAGAAEAADRGGADCQHDVVQYLGGISQRYFHGPRRRTSITSGQRVLCPTKPNKR
jgi:hypothetical protein